ncbi:MAG: RHS repeat-associated core domain-containing protein [Acidobacteriota bacterium]
MTAALWCSLSHLHASIPTPRDRLHTLSPSPVAWHSHTRYDPTGNRTASHISAFYTYNRANQLLEDAEFTYSYDLDGNCIGKVSKLTGERHEYIFNSENRMTGYRKHDINNILLTSASYFYDPLGRRIAKEVDGLLTRYVYQNEDIWMVIDPYDAFTRIVHGPGIHEPLVHVAGGQDTPPRTEAELTYYFADGLGTIRNTVTKRCFLPTQLTAYAYDSFGRPTASTTLPTAAPAYAFTGREWDAESETYFYRARQYDPRIGRFASEDPVAVAPFYAYAASSPTMFTDPSGGVTVDVKHHYQVVTWIDMLWHCYPERARMGAIMGSLSSFPWGCTKSRIRVTCDCCGKTASVFVKGRVQVWAYGGQVLAEEVRVHADPLLKQLTRIALKGQLVEAVSYPTPEACESACQSFEEWAWWFINVAGSAEADHQRRPHS